MLFGVLLLISGVYGAALPSELVVAPQSVCLNRCFANGNIVNAANDLKNFKSMTMDIENFCQINSQILKCGSECNANEFLELETRTAASKYACSQKIEEFRLVRDCMTKSDIDDVAICMSQCGLGKSEQATDAFRLDSVASSPLNPTAVIDGIAPTCKNHICVVQCATRSLNSRCAGAGDLFKDLTRAQIERGTTRLLSEMSDRNNTRVQNNAENYWEKLPVECLFLKDADVFNLLTTAEESPNVTAATKLEVTQKVIVSNMDAELAAQTSPTPISEIPVAVTETTVDIETEKEEKERMPIAANDEAFVTHVFAPEDDFVPFGSPANVTSEEATESPSVALPEEDVKLAKQGAVSSVEVDISTPNDDDKIITKERTQENEETGGLQEENAEETRKKTKQSEETEFFDSTDVEATTEQKNIDVAITTNINTSLENTQNEDIDSTPKMSKIEEDGENDETTEANSNSAEHDNETSMMEEMMKHGNTVFTTEQVIVVNDNAANNEEIHNNEVVTIAPEMEVSSATVFSVMISFMVAALYL